MIKILHASTPKHFATRLQIYETFDEYVLSIKNLINITSSIKKIILTIRYRENQHCDFDRFKKIIDCNNKNVIFKSDNNFEYDLSNSDLLISFSSTAIERALIKKIPVGLYSISSRFRYINLKNNSKNHPIINLDNKNLKNKLDYFCSNKRHIKREYFRDYVYSEKKYNYNKFIDYLIDQII